MLPRQVLWRSGSSGAGDITDKRPFKNTIIHSLILILAVLIISLPAFSLISNAFSRLSDAWLFFGNYFSYTAIWVVCIAFMFLFEKDRSLIEKIIPGKNGNNLIHAFVGISIGFAANLLCVAAALLNKDIFLVYNNSQPVMCVLLFFAIAIQSGAEELLFRIYLFGKIRREYKSPAAAIIVPAAVFALFHIFNKGFSLSAFISIFMFGLFLSLLIYYYNSFFLCAFFHTAWNFTQNIVFGLPNSGIVSQVSVFALDAERGSATFFYNPVFGIESCLMCITVFSVMSAIIFIINKRKEQC